LRRIWILLVFVLLALPLTCLASEEPAFELPEGVFAILELSYEDGSREVRELKTSGELEDAQYLYEYLEYIYKYDEYVYEILTVNGVELKDTPYYEFSGVIRSAEKESEVDIILDDTGLVDRGATEEVKAKTPQISENVHVLINGELLLTQAKAFIMDGRTYLPYRAIFEKVGAENIGYRHFGESIVVWGYYNGTKVEMATDNKKAYINGKAFIMDAPVILKNNSTYIPIRYFSNFVGGRIEWDEKSRVASIFTK